ncbi:MAG: rod shape-determining protein MreC [Armatimonadetes bacterium]|nr:rod shape-determining protein MreC [Armatimonadota bacterium]
MRILADVLSRPIALFVLLLFVTLLTLTLQVRMEQRRQVGAVGMLVLTLLAPVQDGLTRAADAGAGSWRLLAEIGALRTENARLHAEVARLSREAADLRERAAATERLERLLVLTQERPGRLVAGRVIARDAAVWLSTVMVDHGRAHGVRRGAPVVVPEGLVGRVMEAAPASSRVLLITDSRSAVGALLQRSRDVGVVEGTGHPMLVMRYLSRGADVRAGDAVVTSGLGGVFPRGLVIGTVVEVAKDQVGLFQEAKVKPAVDLGRLEEVLIGQEP